MKITEKAPVQRTFVVEMTETEMRAISSVLGGVTKDYARDVGVDVDLNNRLYSALYGAIG